VLLTVAGLAASTVLVWRANSGLSDSLERERQNSYDKSIALAEREWSVNNLRQAEQSLDACPADLRGWEWHYLKRRRLEGLPPLDHHAAMFFAEFSPDGRWIASGSPDGKVRIWDATTGRERPPFQPHKNHVRCLSFTTD